MAEEKEMRSKLNLWLSSGVMASAFMAAGMLPAAAAPGWCQKIANGLYCAPTETPPPDFCGTKPVSVALADGFAANPWRQMTTAAAINEASRCPNVTSWTHTDGQGNTQKAISDVEGLAARGVNAIVVFPDAGPVMLPAIRDAYKQGSAVVPFRAKVGGKEGVDYTVFVGTNFYDHGVIWGNWLVKALNGKGNIAYLGGPPGTSESTEKSKGLHDAFKDHPGIKWIGQEPFEVTNWDPSLIAKAEGALIARYPQIDGIVGDLSIPILTSGAFPRAGRDLPLVAGEDANGFGCEWEKLHANGAKSSFQFTTTSAEQWNVRLAIQWAIASAAGGKVDQPLVVVDTKGGKHVVAKPGDKIVTNFTMDDSLKGIVFCNPNLPASAGNGSSLTVEQTLGALKGGL
jgi:ribose transport system substrate-binding protein